MKHRVFLIAAALCAAVITLNTTGTGCSSEEATAPALPYVSAEGVTTAEIELIPPAGAKAGGDFHFSFLTGKVEWTPGMIPLVVGDHPPKQERGPAELPFSMMGEADMKSVPVVILSESEIKSILSTGDFPEKKAATNPDRLNRESFYVLKDETDHSFYVFRLKDNSPKYVWQQIEYVRIGEGESWKENENPGLSALVKSASNTKTGTSRSIEKKKTNAETTRQKIIQAWREKNDADRRKGENSVLEEQMNMRIELVNRMYSGDTFPKTAEEISLVEFLINGAEYDKLIELCKGKKLDFNVNAVSNQKVPLLYRAIESDPERRTKDFLDRKNNIFEFVLNNGGAAVIPTEGGMACVEEAAATNNKFAFDLLVKDGFDFNRKNSSGSTIQEHLLRYRNIAKIDAEIMKKINSESKLSLYMRLHSIDAADLKKELEDKENPVDVNKPDGSGKTLLDYAIDPKEYCSPAIVSTLLDAGAKFKQSTVRQIISSNKGNYFLPIFWQHRDELTENEWYDCFRASIDARNIEAFKFFLEQRLDPDKKTNNPYVFSPLMNVYENGTQEMMELMEARGYKKPFWAAVKWNDLELAKEYLDAGVDVNEADQVTHQKPILHAVSAGNLKMAELLLEHGVKVSPDDYRRWEDHYPVASAATGGQTKMVELLLKHGFVTDFPKTPGDTKHPRQSSALYIALLHKHYETAKLLLKYGARTDVTDEKTVFDREQGKSVKIDAGLEELFKNDPEALKVLGAEKGIFDLF